MFRPTVSLIALLTVVTVRADVIQLRSGDRIEGTFKQATADGAVIRVGGQEIVIPLREVRAILLGNEAAQDREVRPAANLGGTASAETVHNALAGDAETKRVSEADEEVRSVYPAVNFGRNTWTAVLVKNNSAEAKTVRIESFSASGERLEAITLSVDAGQTAEHKLQPLKNGFQICWIQMSHYRQTSIKVTVEVLRGNKIESFERAPQPPMTGVQRWVDSTAALRGKLLYYINLSSQPTVVAYCVSDSPQFSCRGYQAEVQRQRKRERSSSISRQDQIP
jgi:hypothetical protein